MPRDKAPQAPGGFPPPRGERAESGEGREERGEEERDRGAPFPEPNLLSPNTTGPTAPDPGRPGDPPRGL